MKFTDAERENGMGYIENPKTEGSGIICCIPQKGRCPNECLDCFFQSGRSYLEPLEDNLPNMPNMMQMVGRILRVNDGNDSFNDYEWVMRATQHSHDKFYNTSNPVGLDMLHDAPVVLTINPGKMTDHGYYLLAEKFITRPDIVVPSNLMFVRIRTNMWNIDDVVDPAVKYYTNLGVPVVLTFMAYESGLSIPDCYKDWYELKTRTLNPYYAITQDTFELFLDMYKLNNLVYTCGKDADTHACKHCGNCLREYYATRERMKTVDG